MFTILQIYLPANSYNECLHLSLLWLLTAALSRYKTVNIKLIHNSCSDLTCTQDELKWVVVASAATTLNNDSELPHAFPLVDAPDSLMEFHVIHDLLIVVWNDSNVIKCINWEKNTSILHRKFRIYKNIAKNSK